MRTTVTVDPDVEQLLREAMQRSGLSFKATLNQAIRKGLTDLVAEVAEPPFVVTPHAMQVRTGIDPGHLQRASDAMDVESFLELTRRLEQTHGGLP